MASQICHLIRQIQTNPSLMFSAAPESKIVADHLLARQQKHKLQQRCLWASRTDHRTARPSGWARQAGVVSPCFEGSSSSQKNTGLEPISSLGHGKHQLKSLGLLPQAQQRAGRVGRRGGRRQHFQGTADCPVSLSGQT